jgi:hypothetical protein
LPPFGRCRELGDHGLILGRRAHVVIESPFV